MIENGVSRRAAITSLATLALGSNILLAEDKATAGGFVDLSDVNISDPPQQIGGPVPSLLRMAEVGQLVIVHASYPIVPPFPKSARITGGAGVLVPVGVYRVGGILVPWDKAYEAPPIGVGYLAGVLRAVKKGETHFDLEVKCDDGSLKKTSYAFKVE